MVGFVILEGKISFQVGGGGGGGVGGGGGGGGGLKVPDLS